MIDRIIADRIWWLISSSDLLNSNQIGFRKGKSTVDALLLLQHLAVNSLATRNHLTIVSLDFEKAYDKIGIHTVIDQLISWTFGPKVINYVKNF